MLPGPPCGELAIVFKAHSLGVASSEYIGIIYGGRVVRRNGASSVFFPFHQIQGCGVKDGWIRFGGFLVLEWFY